MRFLLKTFFLNFFKIVNNIFEKIPNLKKSSTVQKRILFNI